jgi:hypothetical protein
MSAAATVLSCAMTLAQPQPALVGQKIMLNIFLEADTARAIGRGAEPLQPLRFEGEAGPQPGWVIHNALDPNASPIMISRVIAQPSPFLRQGKAERLSDGSYRFTEQMRGPCRLVAESDLK